MSERGRLTAEELEYVREAPASYTSVTMTTDLLDHIAAVERERDVAVAVVEAAREAVNACSTYRRLLANELRRLAPNEPLDIHPDASMAAGAHVGRFRRLLRDYDAATRAEEGSRGPHHHN